jgi:hypothetical protein
LVEGLEGRQLLAFSALGASLPDLTVSGFAPPVASWGQPLAVTVNVQNIGSSTLFEPLPTVPSLTTGTPTGGSGADAPASTVDVFAVPARRAGTTPHPPKTFAGAVKVGTVQIPAIPGNGAVQVTGTITLPTQPPGFPGDGGFIFLVFKANADGSVFESDTTNDVSAPVRVQIEAPLPELAAVGLDVPPVMQPGDTIQPNIRIANFGTADTAAQGVLQVALVASTTPTFNSGSSIIALYNVPNVPSQARVPSITPVFGDANLIPPVNVVTIAGADVTLPTTPAVYFIGVVIDPFGQIKQLQKVPQFTRPRNPFSLAHQVGPPIVGLPPAGVLVAGGAANTPVFPFPFGGNPIGGLPNGGGFPVPFPPQSLASIAQNNGLTTTTATTTGSSVTVGTGTGVAPSASAAAQFGSRRAVLNAFLGTGNNALANELLGARHLTRRNPALTGASKLLRGG